MAGLVWLTLRRDRKLLLFPNLSDSTQNTEWANKEPLPAIYTKVGDQKPVYPAEVRRSFNSLRRACFLILSLFPLFSSGLCFLFLPGCIVSLHCCFLLSGWEWRWLSWEGFWLRIDEPEHPKSEIFHLISRTSASKKGDVEGSSWLAEITLQVWPWTAPSELWALNSESFFRKNNRCTLPSSPKVSMAAVGKLRLKLEKESEFQFSAPPLIILAS